MANSKCSFYKPKLWGIEFSFGQTARLERHSTSGGGKYKGILQQLMMERDYAYKRQIRYFVNEDIDKFMRRLS